MIAAKRDFPNAGNFYADSEMKHRSLLHYFNMLLWKKIEYMFIGEAPGKDGCERTGIPFTSERLIRRGQFKKYLPYARFVVEGNQAERSATVIWGSVETLARPSLMWNVVFPLHPFDEIFYSRMFELDQTLGGAGIHNINNGNLGMYEIKDRDIFRPLQYICQYLSFRFNRHMYKIRVL